MSRTRLRSGHLWELPVVVLMVFAGLTCLHLGLPREQPLPRTVHPVLAVPVDAPVLTHDLPPVRPVHLSIPVIGVSSGLIELGLSDDGTLAMPRPGPRYDHAGWYRGSPAPGSVGPAVIAGHVDSARAGPSVFFRLRSLQKGDVVTVTRADRLVVQFQVDTVVAYAKDRFPTALVYGDTKGSEIRLITCGGDFDRSAGHYLENTVVSAHLVGAADRQARAPARGVRLAAKG